MKELTSMADHFLSFVKKFGLIIAIVVVVGYLIKKTWFWITMPILLSIGITGVVPSLELDAFKITCLWLVIWTLLGKVFKVTK